MDKINIIFSEPVFLINDSKVQYYQIQIALNDKIIGNSMFNTAYVLSAAQFKFAEFFLFTCSCGVPGCAGFHEPIVQTQNENMVEWSFPKENYYKTEKLNYHFSKVEFEETMQLAYEKLVALEHENVFCESMIDENSETYSIHKTWNELKKMYEEDESVHFFIMENFHDLIEKKFLFQHQEKQSQYEMSIQDIFNRFEMKTLQEMLFFRESIQQGNVQKLIENYLKRHEMTLDDFFEFDFQEKINFEIQHLSLHII